MNIQILCDGMPQLIAWDFQCEYDGNNNSYRKMMQYISFGQATLFYKR